jgi:rhodanese-related sulfurtransferase
LNEKTLRLKDIPYEAVHLHPASHASYYPGAFPLSLKILFNTETGVLLGAQAVGKDGAEKRIDVLATAIAAAMTVEQIAQLELCYAPPLGSAKDPVNLAGMIASNIRQGLLKQIQWHEVEAARSETGAVVLDVRDPKECAGGAIPGSVNIPLDALRERISEVPTGVPLIVHCATGLRSYYANRILLQHGFSDVRNLSGSWKTWSNAKS